MFSEDESVWPWLNEKELKLNRYVLLSPILQITE